MCQGVTLEHTLYVDLQSLIIHCHDLHMCGIIYAVCFYLSAQVSIDNCTQVCLPIQGTLLDDMSWLEVASRRCGSAQGVLLVQRT